MGSGENSVIQPIRKKLGQSKEKRKLKRKALFEVCRAHMFEHLLRGFIGRHDEGHVEGILFGHTGLDETGIDDLNPYIRFAQISMQTLCQ